MNPDELKTLIETTVRETVRECMQGILKDEHVRLADAVRLRTSQTVASISVPRAMKQFGRGREFFVALVRTKTVRGAYVPGRGRGGRELTLNRDDLEAYFNDPSAAGARSKSA